MTNARVALCIAMQTLHLQCNSMQTVLQELVPVKGYMVQRSRTPISLAPSHLTTILTSSKYNILEDEILMFLKIPSHISNEFLKNCT